jgi:hypothetical protein
MAYSDKKWALAALLEDTYGTFNTPSITTNLIMTSRPQITPNNRTITRNHPLAGYGEQAQAIIGETVKVTFDVEMTADFDTTAPGTEPPYGILLEACNHVKTINAGTSIVYLLTPNMDGPSLSFLFYHDNRVYKIAGARGTYSLSPAAGDMVVIKFEFTGLFLADEWVADGTYTNPVFTLQPYLKFEEAATAIGAYTGPIINTFNFTLGAVLSNRPDAGSPNGIKSVYINNVVPTLSIDPEMGALSTFNPFAGQYANTLYDVSTEFKSATRKCVLSSKKMQLTEVGANDARDNLMNYALNMKATNTEVSLTFSNVAA